MAKVSDYASATALNEGMFFYCAIDTQPDGIYESRKTSLATVRARLYDTNSNIFKLSRGADLTAAAALTIEADGNYFLVNGVTSITSLSAVKVGTLVVLEFAASLTLTHHATNLILPGGANIQTVAGDTGMFVELVSGQWKCIQYTRASYLPQGAIPAVYMDAVPQALSGAGAVDIVAPVTNFTSTGATDALTLVDSTLLGQIKVLNHEVDGGGYVLTPTTLRDGTTITVTDPGVSITLMWTATGWRLVSQTGVAVIA